MEQELRLNINCTCEEKMNLRKGPHGYYYLCSNDVCSNIAWVNNKGKVSKPADSQTRRLRHRCHQAFDPIWGTGLMTRNEAYKWLKEELGFKTAEEAHIGQMDADACKRLLEIVQDKWDSIVAETVAEYEGSD